MRKVRGTGAVAAVGAVAFVLAGCSSANNTQASGESNAAKTFTTQELTDGKTEFTRVVNPNGGATLSFATGGSMKVIEVVDGDYTYAFKDMNANGTLDPFEDWRLDDSARAADLAPQLSKEQQAGLMLFSSHERAPGDGLTDKQKEYLSGSHLRAVLNAGTSDAKQNVQWVNEMQAYVETLASAQTPYVPVNYSSDPRSDASKDKSFSEVGEISKWPSSLGLAATFSPSTVLEFAKAASAEYKALGIGTALSPQIDLATEPRWLRVSGTFGEDSTMAGDMAKAYVEGFQGTFGADGANQGWGSESVNAMIKHWPGDGVGESGRESHTNAGKYAVYPGDNAQEHLSVFKKALESAAVMTSYSAAVAADGSPEFAELKGTSYDSGKLDALRKDANYQGVVVTDWGVTKASTDADQPRIATGWGVADMTVDERHFEIIKNGTDMFGGNNDVAPVLAAYDMWQEKFEKGELEVDAATRWAQSAQRILTMGFANDGFDNPFLVLEDSQAVVGSQDKVEAGREAQLNSIVMLKNADNTVKFDAQADYSDKVVYIPQTADLGSPSLFGEAEYTYGPSVDVDVAKKFFKDVVTDEVALDADGKISEYKVPDLSNVDMVLVGMHSPTSGNNFSKAGWDQENNTWYPLSLQYRPYTADGEHVRTQSISGDTLADGSKENRSYFGHTSRITNAADLDALLRAREAITASGKNIPLIAVIKANNPVIPAEFEEQSDAIFVGFGTADEALLRVALGLHKPAGRLPIQFPKDMDTVEANKEDVPKDVTPYTDSQGNTYDYGFGLGADNKPLK
ncbi:glycoside hydrolase family 3 N-terminal domain-containing protein [Schaalia sp. lx-100]|uniref:glycoside hydrolase family 3 N-terminal domain-containing protein n=1 Tax=Schaalia sp. lx-100 TaxID=2899081 RepID=UPI001E41C02C|nr:glycoside hydrolase family 3 N-terminal domain-containing protein [Schaalia sp. lx-100]MCD4558205.1 glycoside hydrolase family 3 C-terminal domain-containing protein [Schaalia sp. lx-100]